MTWPTFIPVGGILDNRRLHPLNPRAGAGGKRPRQPSRDTVIRLGVGLRLPLHDIDDLLMAAGYAPLVR